MPHLKPQFLLTIILSCFLLQFTTQSKAETPDETMQRYILTNARDSINNFQYNNQNYLSQIAKEKDAINYALQFELVVRSLNNKNSNLVFSYVTNQLPRPNNLNLDYVRIFWVTLLELKNKNRIEEANKIYKNVNEYILLHEENRALFNQAKAYLKTHLIVNQLIAENYTEGQEGCLEIIKVAKEYENTELQIIGYYHLSDFLIIENRIDEYIFINELADSLGEKLHKLNPYKSAVKINLANAYIFKNIKMDKVKMILLDLYNGKATKETSYILYLQFIANQPLESIHYKAILNHFKVKNLAELWGKIYSEVKNWENLPAKRNIVKQMTTTFEQHQMYENALLCSKILAKIQKEIYSTELKNSVVALDLAENKQEISQLTIANKQKQVIILIVFMFILLIVGILFYHNGKIKKKNTTISSTNTHLIELNKIKNQFFTNISHELRTPLTLIKGTIELALLQPHIPKEIEKLLNMSYKSSSKLENKIDELLTLSKIESNKLQLRPVETELNHLISKVCSPFEVIAQSKNIHLITNFEKTSNLNSNIDESHFETIINNLVTNAFKFTPENKKVTITSSSIDKNSAQIVVENEGVLIDNNDLKMIFERFYQSNAKSHLKGIGIGLALSRKLADLMGGSLSVKNATDGPKFTFTFSLNQSTKNQDLKALPLDNSEEELDLSFSLGQNLGQRYKVLIIEDDKDLTLYLTSLLKESFIIESAYNGLEAIELLKTNSYDVILSDILMPELDGIEFFKRIKNDPLITDIPIMFLTAVTDLKTKIKAFDIGVTDYITKPFQAKELISRLSNIASKANREIGPQDKNEKLLGELQSLIETNIDSKDLTVEFLCDALSITPKTLSRKLQKVANITPSSFIKQVRLMKGRELLLEKKHSSIKEISNSVGFSRPDYFTREFYKQYQTYPKDLL